MNVNADSETTALSNAIENFRRLGYHHEKGFFPREKALAAANWLKSQDLEKLARSWTDQEPAVPLAVYQDVAKGKTPISELASNEELLRMAGRLIDDEVYIWSSKVNFKAAWCGTAEYYHQDFVYWKDRGYAASDMLSCMVVLEPHNIKNGGLHFVPGSHHEGFVDHQSFININGLSKYMIAPKTMNELNAKYGLEVVDAQPGDVFFFHTNLVHGSAHNISGDSRMILLSQLNSKSNMPKNVGENARQFNLRRAEMELKEAERRLKFFKEKYERQLASQEVTFNAPIPDEEKNGY